MRLRLLAEAGPGDLGVPGAWWARYCLIHWPDDKPPSPVPPKRKGGRPVGQEP